MFRAREIFSLNYFRDKGASGKGVIHRLFQLFFFHNRIVQTMQITSLKVYKTKV